MIDAAWSGTGTINLDVVHGEFASDAELQPDAATTVVGDDRHDARRRLGLVRQVKRHLRRQDAVVVDIVRESVDVGVLGQVNGAQHRLAIQRRLAVVQALCRQFQLSVLRLQTPSYEQPIPSNAARR